MKILITGAAGFAGKNLTAALCAIRDGKDRRFPALTIDVLYLVDRDTELAVLEEGCKNADFVFHLAGVNRPEDPAEFMAGNRDFLAGVCALLRAYNNTCPVLLTSSVQASLLGRYNNAYGKSKRAAEEVLLQYSAETGAKILIYRHPNLFGKWCRPHYNSVVATFCSGYANDQPVTVDDPDTELELLYIDDWIDEMLAALMGTAHPCVFEGLRAVPAENGPYYAAPVTHRVTLGEIIRWLEVFKAQPKSLLMPQMPDGSFQKKLYAAYLSYLPKEKIAFPLKTNADSRGSFTELMRFAAGGQMSVNITKPGVKKGQHWHHTKWEQFIVVSGHGRIRMRTLGAEEVLSFEVTGDVPQAVHMLPGYTHELVNLSETEDLVTVMWASEGFDPDRPDTFFEEV